MDKKKLYSVDQRMSQMWKIVIVEDRVSHERWDYPDLTNVYETDIGALVAGNFM